MAGRQALVARTGYTGEDGFELFVPPEDAVPLWEALTAAGAGAGLVPAGLSAATRCGWRRACRCTATSSARTMTPFEPGLGRVVRFDKPGDFVGRDGPGGRQGRAANPPQAGRPGRRGRRVPRHGYPVVQAGGAVVGEVTSGRPLQTLGRPIAMAYVDTGVNAGLAVDIRGSQEPVDVVELPFYRRNK